jgi:DNA-binding phage protein
MSPKDRDWDDFQAETLADPQEAAAYLSAALEEGDTQLLAQALRNVANARKRALGEKAHLPPDFERTLSDSASLCNILPLLKGFGFKLSVDAQ